ncbi:hypothetical protein GN244_ATG17010 [Phytophthora infestans]|uniref:Uncharacterized protein n=1 Tax=Phytophthora infestans TaxID=4787 RepID=A0A833SZ99_PHYIN|nr:hypothetical protein GN244_ATG17214 [Phytophthora infestans]KAF4031138.1 hypothetical protein GN244_ATG17010 [Phytophthora infestans]
MPAVNRLGPINGGHTGLRAPVDEQQAKYVPSLS